MFAFVVFPRIGVWDGGFGDVSVPGVCLTALYSRSDFTGEGRLSEFWPALGDGSPG